ncbi:hypothetical protein [Thomasclavelia sp.]
MKTFIISLCPILIGFLIADIFIVQSPITLKLIIKDIIASVISTIIILIMDKKFNSNKKITK